MQPSAVVMSKRIEEKPSDVKLHMSHFGTLYMNNNFIRGNFVVVDCMVVEVLLPIRRGRMEKIQVMIGKSNDYTHTILCYYFENYINYCAQLHMIVDMLTLECIIILITSNVTRS